MLSSVDCNTELLLLWDDREKQTTKFLGEGIVLC